MLTAQQHYEHSAMTAHGWMAKAIHSIDFHGSFAVQGLSASIDLLADALGK